MIYKDAISYYKLIKEEFSDNDEKFAEFYEYFENTWFSLTNSDSTRYSFSLWSYSGKFNFEGNKKLLISENNLKEYINFTNNAVESFNHLLNECLSKNIKVSFNKFEEIIKYVFIKFEGTLDSNIAGYTEHTLISDILRELVNSGFGKNNKIIKQNDLKKIKACIDSNKIYSLTFDEIENDNIDDDN